MRRGIIQICSGIMLIILGCVIIFLMFKNGHIKFFINRKPAHYTKDGMIHPERRYDCTLIKRTPPSFDYIKCHDGYFEAIPIRDLPDDPIYWVNNFDWKYPLTKQEMEEITNKKIY